jgi:hypothetical protein
MSQIVSLAALFDDITLTPEERKKPALLRPHGSHRLTSRIDNDKVGICPHCSGKMEISSISIARLGAPMKVYLCAKDRYIAPLKDEA